MRFVAYGDRKQVAAALKPIYQASSAEAALDALDAFADSVPGRKYPSAVKSFRDAWERFTCSWRSHPSCAGSSTPPTASSR